MATKALVGEKVGMTQIWDDTNRVVPVTVLRIQPLRVVQVKTNERDGYGALQVTYGAKQAKKLTKPEAGHFAKQGVAPGKRLVELRLDDVDGARHRPQSARNKKELPSWRTKHSSARRSA